nr:hypothetical protein [Tanacetum cinerariifolium]
REAHGQRQLHVPQQLPAAEGQRTGRFQRDCRHRFDPGAQGLGMECALHRRQRHARDQAADDGEHAEQGRGQRAIDHRAALIGVQQKAVVQPERRRPVHEPLKPMTHARASVRSSTQALAMRRPASITLLVAVAIDRRN